MFCRWSLTTRRDPKFDLDFRDMDVALSLPGMERVSLSGLDLGSARKVGTDSYRQSNADLANYSACG